MTRSRGAARRRPRLVGGGIRRARAGGAAVRRACGSSPRRCRRWRVAAPARPLARSSAASSSGSAASAPTAATRSPSRCSRRRRGTCASSWRDHPAARRRRSRRATAWRGPRRRRSTRRGSTARTPTSPRPARRSRSRDLEALGQLAEHSALKMHAVGLAARPPLLYWRGATVECIHRVWALRADGMPAFVTIDAGPAGEGAVRARRRRPASPTRSRDVPGVERVLTCAPGGGAEVVRDERDRGARARQALPHRRVGRAARRAGARRGGRSRTPGSRVEPGDEDRVASSRSPRVAVSARRRRPGAAARAATRARCWRRCAGWARRHGRLRVVVDSRAFLVGERKLGLGRSAATLVAATVARARRRRRRRRGRAAHARSTRTRVFQGGQGSGADVAAAVHGGVDRGAADATASSTVTPHGAARRASSSSPAGPARPRTRRRCSPRFAAAAACRALADLARPPTSPRPPRSRAATRARCSTRSSARRRCSSASATSSACRSSPRRSPRWCARRDRAGAAAKPSGAGGGDCGIAFAPLAGAGGGRARRLAGRRHPAAADRHRGARGRALAETISDRKRSHLDLCEQAARSSTRQDHAARGGRPGARRAARARGRRGRRLDHAPRQAPARAAPHHRA